jgi:tetratricopeptide (TPR) repeat protein
MSTVEHLLNELTNDTENPIKNAKLADYYYWNGQYAGALSFYLRAAERVDSKDIQYYCLIKAGRCLEIPGNRRFTVKTLYTQAAIICPERPEAYYLMSRYYEWGEDWINAYYWADQGLKLSKQLPKELYIDEYPGDYALLFQKAISSWWWNKCDESKEIHKKLIKEYFHIMDDGHLQAVIGNMRIVFKNG